MVEQGPRLTSEYDFFFLLDPRQLREAHLMSRHEAHVLFF